MRFTLKLDKGSIEDFLAQNGKPFKGGWGEIPHDHLPVFTQHGEHYLVDEQAFFDVARRDGCPSVVVPIAELVETFGDSCREFIIIGRTLEGKDMPSALCD